MMMVTVVLDESTCCAQLTLDKSCGQQVASERINGECHIHSHVPNSQVQVVSGL